MIFGELLTVPALVANAHHIVLSKPLGTKSKCKNCDFCASTNQLYHTLSLSIEFLFNKPIELFIVVMAVYVGIVLLLISIYCDLANIVVLMILFDDQGQWQLRLFSDYTTDYTRRSQSLTISDDLPAVIIDN